MDVDAGNAPKLLGRSLGAFVFSEFVVRTFLGISALRMRRLLWRTGLLGTSPRELNEREVRAIMAEHYKDVGERLLKARPGNRTPGHGKG